ncbi:Efm2p [Sugiyamaella lignohabitans]|uniref:Efm2p n=1 Tax=Sugiyamaella lignohabitans TaxID=796027 RepID=A0A167FT42_9ASCO|nr:Efm2p [Sugiyamaella lignohabitans]ANB15671.1 Efm2p [Sugiyamaella lignohabitans]
MTVEHIFDLPNIRKSPDAAVISSTLDELAPKKRVKNFSRADDNFALFDQSSLFVWLTSLLASPLDWIDSEDVREEIWASASLRLSERCGRTAAPEFEREIEVTLADGTPLEIRLLEPSLTEDSLGLKTWGSALVLANRLAKEHAKLLRDPILELGSGTGLSGIVAAKLGHEIWVSDLPEIIDNLRRNVSMNCNSSDNIRAEVLDWANPSESEIFKEKKEEFSSILVSDPIYSPQHPKMVCDMIKTFLRHTSDALVCVQLPLRRKFEQERTSFYAGLESIGLVRIRYEIEHGVDDFGEMDYAWSSWKWRD